MQTNKGQPFRKYLFTHASNPSMVSSKTRGCNLPPLPVGLTKVKHLKLHILTFSLQSKILRIIKRHTFSLASPYFISQIILSLLSRGSNPKSTFSNKITNAHRSLWEPLTPLLTPLPYPLWNQGQLVVRYNLSPTLSQFHLPEGISSLLKI